MLLKSETAISIPPLLHDEIALDQGLRLLN
jgi:hypothetical protein